MSDNQNKSETLISQFVPKISNYVPNVEELKTRLALMASIPKSGVNLNDTEAEALDKLAKIGISGDNVPLSDNQRLAVDYKIAAKMGTESELVNIYQASRDPNLNKLLDAYVIESKIRSQALEMPNHQAGFGHKDEPLKEFEPLYGMVAQRIQENVATLLETGARLELNGIKPSEQERLAVMYHLVNMQGHADSKAIKNANVEYEPTL